MSETKPSTLEVDNRIISLMAQGKGSTTIGKILTSELGAEYSKSGIEYRMRLILNDPHLNRRLDNETKIATRMQVLELTSIARETLDKIKFALDKAQINPEPSAPLDPYALKVVEIVTPLLNTWWRNLAELTGMLKKAGVEINLTQVNVEQVNSANTGLLSLVQDLLRFAPENARRDAFQRLEEMSRVIDVKGKPKDGETNTSM